MRAKYFLYYTENEGIACTPSDIINLSLKFDETKRGNTNYKGKKPNRICSPECFERNYIQKISSSGNVDSDALKYFINDSHTNVE